MNIDIAEPQGRRYVGCSDKPMSSPPKKKHISVQLTNEQLQGGFLALANSFLKETLDNLVSLTFEPFASPTRKKGGT